MISNKNNIIYITITTFPLSITSFLFSIFMYFSAYGSNKTNKRKREDDDEQSSSKKPALNEEKGKANQEESVPKNEPKKEPKLKEAEVIPSGSNPTSGSHIPDAGPKKSNSDESGYDGSDEMDYYPSDMDIDMWECRSLYGYSSIMQ